MTQFSIEKLLTVLGFERDLVNNMWRRSFPNNVELRVDCANERFLYTEAGITVTTATTSNFSQPENFVVFECVCRLLEKGYKPKDLELEPAWRFGHNEKAARADIWVRTTDKKGKHSLIIIECKTAGREFESAWRDTCEDGGQLFSYFHQEKGTSFLCLYTSELIESADGKIEISFEYRLINVQDNEEFLKTLKKPKTYAKAENAKALFAAWRDTYSLDYATVGLFEQDIAAYKPGKNKYFVDDLSVIDHATMQRKYNEFATILRQHNVSGRENAFDKLVNLFLAKVVDESRNRELMFYWKGIAYDTAFDLQDRLEQLYSIGMKEFLGETVTYIREADIRKAFRRFENDPDATKEAVLDYFRRLKFYTNNDFSFIDVHNERLFLENAAILLKIVQMLEDIRLITDEPNQFLGDLFEGFLDNGVKQSEGQFFTPLPIVRFIISSLPLQEMIRNFPAPPRVIDYACGAGHFLNEYAQQIKPFINTYHEGHDKEYFSVITGVEKEYRLSKVAKVAAFMYGEEEIRIVYADALVKSPDMPEESFDILVANPPYSVKGFLETLSEDNRALYDLTDRVSDISRNNTIETFFVERAAQLLKPCGIAAIILPASILSNSDGVYTRCREIILENFDVIAITEFNTGTFEMTGTNTITLFLRKKDAPPDFASHWLNRANAWFNANHVGDEVFEDADALERYCTKRGFDLEEYKSFLNKKLSSSSDLWNSSAFKAYRDAFAKKNAKKKWTEDERVDKEMGFILDQERDRLYYFLLADANPVPVLIVKMPTDTKAAKAFLGYEWSRAKGNEGIKYLGGASSSTTEDDTLSRNQGIKSIVTPLFDNSRLNDEDAPKLNSLIRKNFRGILTDFPEELSPFARCVSLTDMLDFDAPTFDKQIKTSATRKIEVRSRFPLVKLGDVCIIEYGTRIVKAQSTGTKYPVYGGGAETFRTDDFNRENRYIISRFGMSAECVRFVYGKFFLNDSGLTLSPKNEALSDSFLGHLIFILQDSIFALGRGMSQKNLDMVAFQMMMLPLPPLSVQQEVAEECAAVDADYAKAKKTVEDSRAKIAEIMEGVHKKNWPIMVMSEISTELQYGTSEKSLAQGKIPVLRMCNLRDGFIDWGDLVYSDNEKDIAKYSLQANDVLFNRTNSPEHVGKVALYRGERPAIFAGYLIRIKCRLDIIIPAYLSYVMNSQKVREYGFSIMSKSIHQANISGGALAKYMIPVPLLAEQKKVVAAVEALEAKITEAMATMAACPSRKREILRKHGVIL